MLRVFRIIYNDFMITISDINDPRLSIFTHTSETELAHYYEPEPGLFMAESLKVLERALAAGFEPVTALVEKAKATEVLSLLSAYPDLNVFCAEFEVLTEITGYHMTGGVLCIMKRRTLPSLEEICENKTRIAILEDVVNPTNVGAIVRNAAALHIDAIIFSPGCADPLYKRAIRVSMGTIFQIPWTIADGKAENWQDDAMPKLKGMGFATVAMALKEDSVRINDEHIHNEEKLAILLGSEGNGLKDATRSMCDYTVMIPMSHGVDSLNVAAASALAFWELGNNK